MLIDAAKSLGELDVLIYVPEDFDISPLSVARWQERLSVHWDTEITFLPSPRIDYLQRLPVHKIAALVVRSIRDGAASFYPQKVSVHTAGNAQVRAFERALKRRPDVILAHRLGSMAPIARSRLARPDVVFDLDDIQHLKYRRMTDQKRDLSSKARYLLTVPLLRRAESRAFDLAKTTFACSETDRRYLERKMGATGVEVVPNGISVASSLPPAEEPSLLYLGTYEYPPNVDAAVYLLREIWPLIRREMPQARLVLAGAHPNRIPRSGYSLDGVEFPGFVDDLDGLYRRSSLVVCPIRVGSGMRIKILEASAYGRPVVATTVAAEGIELTRGDEIILEDGAQAFAKACLDLLGDPQRGKAIGERARDRVADLYNRGSIVDKIAGHIRSAASEGGNVSRQAPNVQGSSRRFVLVGGTSEPGGLHVHTADVARGLATAGHEVTILSTSHDFFSRLVSGTGVRVVKTEISADSHFLSQLRAWWRTLAPFKGAQGVCCRGAAGAGSLGALLAMWARFSSLYTIEHSLPEHLGSTDGRRSKLRDALAVRLIQRAIAVSETIRQAMLNVLRFPPERVKTCENWVDTSYFAPDAAGRTEARRKLGVDDDSFVIGFVGRLAPEKRIDHLIRGFSRFRKSYSGTTRLVIVGSGWKEEELRALTESLDLGRDVTFVGWADESVRYYRAFDLFVMVSIYEGFPITLLEAMACELPCLSHEIGGAIGGPARCIRHGENGFLIPADCVGQRLEDWLSEVAALSAGERRRIGQAARRTVAEQFSIELRLPNLLEQIDAEDAAVKLRSQDSVSVVRAPDVPVSGE